MKKALSKRIRVTKNGKIMRRSMGVGHSRAKKSSGEKQRKRKYALLGAGRFIKKINNL
ncbi:MAG: bL35 family ribosomal protein [bacterium]|nr:bL35 family ribosomal protein [bacterium]